VEAVSVHDAPDEIGDAAAGLVRTAVTLGGVAAEVIARDRERQARIAAVAAGERAAGVRAMYEAERAFAVGRLAEVAKDSWWDQATPGDIQLAWQDAAAWRDHDVKAAGYAEQIRGQLIERYGVDPDAAPISEPADLAAARARRDQTAERVEAVVTVQATQAAGQDSETGRDVLSAEQIRGRWAASAERMHEAGVPADAAQARLLTDVARSRVNDPAALALLAAQRAGRGRAPARQRQQQQGR
jgi:hypothetical protein